MTTPTTTTTSKPRVSVRRQAYNILEVSAPGNRLGRAFDYLLITLITLSTLSLVLETVQSIYDAAAALLRTFDVIVVTFFLIEYLLRLWVSVEAPRYSHPIWGRLRYAISPLALIDLAAILPYLLIPILPVIGLADLDLRFLRAVRLLSRAARLSRYYSGIRMLGRVVQSKQEELLTVVFVLAILLVLASSTMYFAENTAQPEEFSSIPETMWWSIITLTTVGYGDVFPVTTLGRIIGGVIAILGIGMFALPAGILGSGFLEEIQHSRRPRSRICPHCGEEIAE